MKENTKPLHTMPKDIKETLSSDTSLQDKWDKLTSLAQNEWICWVITCKKQETRDSHLVRMVEDLNKGKKRPCCWPGCPHRRDNAEKWFSEGALKAAKAQMNS